MTLMENQHQTNIPVKVISGKNDQWMDAKAMATWGSQIPVC